MSKANVLVNKFLASRKKADSNDSGTVYPHNSFRAMFDPHELDATELTKLKDLFKENLSLDLSQDEPNADFGDIVRLTSELKAIQKQAVLLVGERIHTARFIFQKYGEKATMAFTSWLTLAFTSRKTAYNALAYYDLYSSLPNPILKEKMKQMPVKVSYALASRKAEEEIKQNIINSYNGEKQDEMLMLLEEQIPIIGDKRSPKSLGAKSVENLEKATQLVMRRSSHLSSQEKIRIANTIKILQNLIELEGYGRKK